MPWPWPDRDRHRWRPGVRHAKPKSPQRNNHKCSKNTCSRSSISCATTRPGLRRSSLRSPSRNRSPSFAARPPGHSVGSRADRSANRFLADPCRCGDARRWRLAVLLDRAEVGPRSPIFDRFEHPEMRLAASGSSKWGALASSSPSSGPARGRAAGRRHLPYAYWRSISRTSLRRSCGLGLLLTIGDIERSWSVALGRSRSLRARPTMLE